MTALYELPGFTISYPDIDDDITHMNDNAEFLGTICLENKLMILNNAKINEKHFSSEKTYKKRGIWVSELDVCVTSPSLVQYLHDFSVIKREGLPSDHAPITVSMSSPRTPIENIISRACTLGDHAVLYGSTARCSITQKPIKFTSLDNQKFINNITSTSPPTDISDVHAFARDMSDTLYRCAKASVNTHTDSDRQTDASLGRWERLLTDKDDARVWKAISWKGNFGEENVENVNSPSDEDFKVHFEHVLNPIPTPPPPRVSTTVTMPVLDEPILPAEVDMHIKRLKADMACGPDGVSPGVLTMLPAAWLLSLTSLFNSIFLSGIYPESWVRAKVFTIFKKGSRSDANNYRGISVINSITKLFDSILCCRLMVSAFPWAGRSAKSA